MSVKIEGTQGRVYNVGGTVLSDGTILFDLREPACTTTYGNIPIRELIEHLNTLEGVTATYEPPRPHRAVPQGIGAVVSPFNNSYIRLVRVFTGSGKNWVQNLRGTPDEGGAWYTDAEIDKYINTSDYVIISEGVTQ